MHKDITAFNNKLKGQEKKICVELAKQIDAVLPKTAESKLWHGGPVWFLDGNPITGYFVVKAGVRLLFWSGQGFDEKGLTAQGSFKASQFDYTNVDQIIPKDLKRWLKKGAAIQWDYKNIVKRKGKLVKIKI